MKELTVPLSVLRLMTQLISQRVGYRACGSARLQRDVAELPTKTQGEIESAIGEFICRLQQEYMGRGGDPKTFAPI